MSTLTYDDLESMQEAANMVACYDAAKRAGYTPEQADLCDDGDRGCPDCPWGLSQLQSPSETT